MLRSLCLVAACAFGSAWAQVHDPSTPASVARKLHLRGDANDIGVQEMRLVRRNGMLLVQADIFNTTRDARTIFYRFKWLDDIGNQVGDGEVWKQLHVRGADVFTVKGLAPHASVVDFKLEMNVEPGR